MLALVTGATGIVGCAVAKRLCAEGHRVRALVRDVERARRHLPSDVELLRGDVTDPPSIAQAMRGTKWLFHAAGIPESWQRDETIFDRTNRQGTANVLEAALAADVKRVIYTSTMDVMAAPRGGTVTEANIDPKPRPTAYERSKQGAEHEADRVRARGLDVVFVNPSAVYGPSPVVATLNQFFVKVLNRKTPLLPPGGMSVVFVDGLAEAHLCAAERGRSGERYLVSDGYFSNSDLAREMARQAGLAKLPPTAPAWLLAIVAYASAPISRLFGVAPLITTGELSFLLWNAHVDASKAQRELGFVPTKLTDGVEKTIAFLRAQGAVR